MRVPVPSPANLNSPAIGQRKENHHENKKLPHLPVFRQRTMHSINLPGTHPGNDTGGQMDIQKVKRRIVNFIHQYATEEQILMIAKMLNIKTDDGKEKEK